MVGLGVLALRCSAMAVTARRTEAKVKSSAMRPRQPEVPNLIGDGEMEADALIVHLGVCETVCSVAPERVE